MLSMTFGKSKQPETEMATTKGVSLPTFCNILVIKCDPADHPIIANGEVGCCVDI